MVSIWKVTVMWRSWLLKKPRWQKLLVIPRPQRGKRLRHTRQPHLPYRSWCPICVAGRRDNAPHKSLTDEERSVPEVGMDYCFIRRAVETETATVLVVKDRVSRAIRVHVLGFKGTCLEEASSIAAGAISQFGHKGAISLKTDNEPALIDLRRETTDKLDIGIMVIKPTAAESQSNGSIEAGVKTFKGLLRVHLASLEKKVAMHLPSAHPLMGWLVEYVADIATKYLASSDGKTAYNRLFGKEVHEEQLEFGEKVLYKLKPSKEQGVVIDV